MQSNKVNYTIIVLERNKTKMIKTIKRLLVKTTN